MKLFLIQQESHARGIFRIALAFFFFVICPLTAAPRGQYAYPDDKAIAIKEMRDALEDIRHEVSNHEVEIRIMDEKLKNADVIIENVREQASGFNKVHKDQLKTASTDFESRISSIESTMKGLIADLRQFQTHSNETTALLAQYGQKLTGLQKTLDHQDQNIEHLQAAIRSLMEALQGKSQAAAKQSHGNSKTESSLDDTATDRYTVKAGDSLEKIARAHQTTVQAIKTANNLTSDRIVVGKTLMIPEK